MILMHRDTPVAKIEMINNKPVRYLKIYTEELLPIGTKGNGSKQEQILLNHWYKSRSIPNLRPNIQSIENKIGKSMTELFIKSSGISLTDTYWFKDEQNTVKWSDINYHDNGFEPVFANYYANKQIDFSPSPDYCTDGIMEKFWLPIENQPYLFKIDTQYKNVLSANEVIFYQIASELNIKTTPYFAGKNDYNDYCCCPCFVKHSNCDFVNAMQIKHTPQKNQTDCFYFDKVGEKLIRFFSNNLGFTKQIKEMITLDCLFHNIDRHERNFGYLLFDDGSTDFVPLFDNGFCLGVGTNISNHIVENNMKLFSGQRKDILQEYGLPIDIDSKFFLRILEEIYQEYSIPETIFHIAKKELEEGIKIIQQNNKILLQKWSIPRYEEEYDKIRGKEKSFYVENIENDIQEKE